MVLFSTPPSDLDSGASINFGGKTFRIEANDLDRLRLLGRGAYGVVEEYQHRPTGIIMAVKRITQTFNNQEQKRLLMDLSVNMRTGNCPYTVKFFGALFREVCSV